MKRLLILLSILTLTFSSSAFAKITVYFMNVSSQDITFPVNSFRTDAPYGVFWLYGKLRNESIQFTLPNNNETSLHIYNTNENDQGYGTNTVTLSSTDGYTATVAIHEDNYPADTCEGAYCSALKITTSPTGNTVQINILRPWVNH